ncbi:hypothetical protein DPMN_068964 [Dreissena polymorpha]|uniref:Uncharacterized protein n=1 Tax=Dreissena polymorpha TaxID=45954 RepID=A0A9D4BMN2_DREPO|nr:hypothetical protein DPMN_068964 [Dreissena polymorpha]
MDPFVTEVSKQETRTFLRERFLRMIGALNGQEAELSLYGKSRVRGTLRGLDIDGQRVQVGDLQTPIGTLPSAYVRMSDVKTITVSDLKSV